MFASEKRNDGKQENVMPLYVDFCSKLRKTNIPFLVKGAQKIHRRLFFILFQLGNPSEYIVDILRVFNVRTSSHRKSRYKETFYLVCNLWDSDESIQ